MAKPNRNAEMTSRLPKSLADRGSPPQYEEAVQVEM
jgi:hypothetical protein